MFEKQFIDEFCRDFDRVAGDMESAAGCIDQKSSEEFAEALNGAAKGIRQLKIKTYKVLTLLGEKMAWVEKRLPRTWEDDLEDPTFCALLTQMQKQMGHENERPYPEVLRELLQKGSS